MREKENQTPRKDYPPRYSATNRKSKDSPAKTTSRKKSLVEAFVSPSEDILADISEDSVDFSSISVISDANYNGETAESFLMELCPSHSTSSETFARSELTPSKTITEKRDEQIDFSKSGSAKVEIVMNLLNQTRSQALNSVDMEDKSKKVIDALINLTIGDIKSLPQEGDKLQLVTRNAYLIFLCFLLWFVLVLLFLSSYSQVGCSNTRSPPT